MEDKLAIPVLHAVGLAARGNCEFVSAAIDAVASWRRWSKEGASKWLTARARAAQDVGIKVDKWWFVNGEYRDDPRARDAISERPLGHPHCDRCRGSGWVIVTRALADGVTMRNFAQRCVCRMNRDFEPVAEPLPQIGALSNAKDMSTVLHSPSTRNASVRDVRVAGPDKRHASVRAERQPELHQGNRSAGH